MEIRRLDPMKTIAAILLLSTVSAFAGPLEDLREKLKVSVKDTDAANAAWQVCENFVQQQLDAAASEKVEAKLAELQQAKEDAAKSIAAKEAEKAKVIAEAEVKANHVLAVLREEKAKQEASGKGPRWEVLDEVEAKANVSAKDILRAEAEKRLEEAKKALDALTATP